MANPSDVIDWDEAMEQCGDDEEFVRELLADLRGETDAQLIKIDETIKVSLSVHERRSPDIFNVQAPQPPTTTQVTSIQGILASGALRGKKEGWRAKELEVAELGCRNERFQQLLREDTKELLGFLSASKGGSARHKNGSARHNKKGCNGRFTNRKNKNNPFTMSYLAKAWGVNRHYPLRLLKKGQQQAKEEKKPSPTRLSVIDSLEAAKIHFSAKNLFIAHRVEERTNEEKVFAYDTHTQSAQSSLQDLLA